MTLPAHLFASDDGALYDTRDPNWSRKPPLRTVYGNASPSLWRTDPVTALQAVNPSVRDSEIETLRKQREDGLAMLEKAALRLEAIRVLVAG